MSKWVQGSILGRKKKLLFVENCSSNYKPQRLKQVVLQMVSTELDSLGFQSPFHEYLLCRVWKSNFLRIGASTDFVGFPLVIRCWNPARILISESPRNGEGHIFCSSENSCSVCSWACQWKWGCAVILHPGVLRTFFEKSPVCLLHFR